jgi:hypothetical protein
MHDHRKTTEQGESSTFNREGERKTWFPGTFARTFITLPSRFLLLCLLLVFGPKAESKDRIFIRNRAIERSAKEAILILPGFGSKMHGTKAIANYFFDSEYDVFIPDYLARTSLDASVVKLEKFIVKHKLREYKTVHLFAYIAGAWTFNRWIVHHPLPNLGHIVYDRSPLQERAPYALVRDIPVLIRLATGKIMRDFSETTYPAFEPREIPVGIMVENKASKLIRKHKESALLPGPVYWEVDSLGQVYDDFFHIRLDHDDVYKKFDAFGAEVFHFFAHGRFSDGVSREPIAKDPFSSNPKR